MPDVRDARVRKRETSETFSRSRYTAFSRSPAAGRLGREAFIEGPAGRLSSKARQRGFRRRPGREAFPEGPNEAIAEFTTVGRSHMQETRVISTREGK